MSVWKTLAGIAAKAVLDVAVEGGKTWAQGVASEHAKRFAERRWGSPSVVEIQIEDAVLVDENGEDKI